MKKNYSTFFIFLLFIINSSAQGLDWVKSIGGNSDDQGTSIAVDGSGNVYTTGYFSGTSDFDPSAGTFSLSSSGTTDIFISKVNSLGNLIWAKKIGGAGDDIGTSLSLDGSGNIYVTGYFNSTVDFDPNAGINNLTSSGSDDIFITKLDANGNLVWVKKLGSSNTDRALSITLDASNNLYLTGMFSNTVDFDPNAGIVNLSSAGQFDVFVLKLSSIGNLIWAKNMGSGSSEVGSAIITDALGNVYTTGEFQGGAADFDPGAGIAILTSTVTGVFISKLDASGNFVWAKSYNEAGGSGKSMCTDASNNLYITGYFSSTTDFNPNSGIFNITPIGFYDAFISKLDASGNFVWAKNIGGSGADFGYSITKDLSGNIYTTGNYQGINTDFDPGTGVYTFTANGSGIFVSKIDAGGNFVGAKAMIGPSNGTAGKCIVLDNTNNIYVTGNYIQTADFDPNNGVVNLTSLNNSNDVFLLKLTACIVTNQPTAISGNASVSAGSSQTYSIASVANATSYNWTLPLIWSGSSTTNTISVVTGTNNGVISVVAQNSCGVSPSSSITVSVSSATNTPINHDWVWAKSTGDQYAANYVMNLTTDALGNVYITGWFTTSTIKFGTTTLNRVGSGTNVYIAKYDPNGNVLWAKNAGGGYGESWVVATDANNNVYISGTFSNPSITFDGVTLTHPTGGGSVDIFIVKYDSQGNLLWAKDVDYTGTAWLKGIAIDPQGNVLIAGSFGSSPITFGTTTLSCSANVHPFLAKFDPSGNVLWAKAPQSTTNWANWCTGVATDLSGNCYITGNYRSNSTNPLTFGGVTLPNSLGDVFLVKYGSNGNVIWAKTAIGNTSYSGGDYPYSVTTDINENIIVTGTLRSSIINFGSITISNSNTNNTPDIFVVKYDKFGNEVWAKKAGGLGDDEGHRITSDQSGNIFVTGYFESKPATFGTFSITKNDTYSPIIFIIKYDENGNEIWVKHVEETSAHSGNLPSDGIAADYLGNIYVAGTAYDGAVFGNTTLTYGGIFVAKLGENQVGVSEINSIENKLILYPNPSTGIIKIKSTISLKNSNVKVFNTQSQTVFETNQFIDEIDLSNQPKGVYFLQIKGENKVINKKVIIQ